jgi:hypothetical protein
MGKTITVFEIQSFLGLAACYQRFIERFFIIVSLLTQLIWKRVEFEWIGECEVSF